MSDADENPFLITPPPGIPVTPPASPIAEEPGHDPENFITLPPGVVESGTFRIPNPRVVTPPVERHTDDITFFPVPIGAPAPVASPLPVEQPVVEADAGETGLSVARHAIPVWRLVLPGGSEVVPVTGTLFIGRNPARTPEWPAAELLAAVDPAKSLSKTHAMLEVEAGILWVRDLNSTNGVFVVPADGEVVEVEAGTRAAVPAGASLELGDYVIQVEHG